jgi:hypothetical protein
MTVHVFIVGVCMLGWHNRANRLCHLGRFTPGGGACSQACFSVYTGSCSQDFNCLTKSNKYSTNSTKISANNLIFIGHFQKCLTGIIKFILKFCRSNRSWERNNISNIGHPCHIHNSSFKSQSIACMFSSTIFS